jgi:Arrestin (or S-antigen), N-terminal domain
MDIGIRLNKNIYEAGETAKGTLIANGKNNVKANKLSFSVCGKERYVKEMIGEYGASSEKYDIFFSEDLYPLLESANIFPRIGNGIEIPQGSHLILFYFSIPNDALESFHGKNVQIAYEVEFIVDRGRWKRDYRKILSFDVNSKMSYAFVDRFYLGEDKKEEGKPYLGLEIEMINGTSDVPKFSPGDILKGKLKIENTDLNRVTRSVIQLYGVESPKWSRVRTLSESTKKEIEYDGNKMKDTIDFKIQIPKEAKRSYNSKHSEYYWVLETHIDIGGASDIRAKRIVQVA